MQKAISPLVSSVLIAAIVVAVSAIVGGWLTQYSGDQSDTLKEKTKSQLSCQFADLYIRNATYNCTLDCSDGVSHSTRVTIVNSGKIKLFVNSIVVQNTTGSIFKLEVNDTYIDPGSTVTVTNVSTQTCNGINRSIEKIIINSPTCPNTAYDSLRGSDVNFLSC